MIQKVGFRNYLHWFRNYRDSETITIQKLRNKKIGFRNYFLQFTQLTRLRTSRFRSSKWYQMPTPHGASNWFGLSTKIRWYQNSHPHGTSNWYWMSMQERRCQNFHPHGTQNWLGLFKRVIWYQNSHPHGTSNWLGLPTRIGWYQNSHPHGTSNWLGLSTRKRWYQNSQPHGTSILTWTVHKEKMISRFPPPCKFKFILNTHTERILAKVPTPWNFKLTWAVHKEKMISKFPPHGTSNWLGLSTRLGLYQQSHPHGTSNWYWMFMQERRYRNCDPMELQIDLNGSWNHLWQTAYTDFLHRWTRTRETWSTTRASPFFTAVETLETGTPQGGIGHYSTQTGTNCTSVNVGPTGSLAFSSHWQRTYPTWKRFKERTPTRSTWTCWETPASALYVSTVYASTRSHGKKATSEASLTPFGTRRSHHTNSRAPGTHSDGSLPSSGSLTLMDLNGSRRSGKPSRKVWWRPTSSPRGKPSYLRGRSSLPRRKLPQGTLLPTPSWRRPPPKCFWTGISVPWPDFR